MAGDRMKRSGMLFFSGAAGYTLLEMIWRGHSHWSMALAGGISLVTLVKVFQRMTGAPLYFKSLVGGGIITAIEFVFGVIFNRLLGMGVWDYSDVKGNILGQICPMYSALWCLLCLPLSFLEKNFSGWKKAA